MSRYFNIKITTGTSVGPYNIYYDAVGSTYATLVSNGGNATGLTLTQLTTGDGVMVSVPDVTTLIILYNNLVGCGTQKEFNITGLETFNLLQEDNGIIDTETGENLRQE
jgi:hypothetical protein